MSAIAIADDIQALSREERRTIARILKVNHAGEHGAIRIYRAQLWAARRLTPDIVSFLSETLEHEISHCRQFREAMVERDARPCRAMWLWGLGGYVLGLVTAVAGRNAVMACTKAVEQTVHYHLDEQLGFLRQRDNPLHAIIANIQIEETQHLDYARLHLRPTAAGAVLESLIVAATESVIWLSTQGAVSRMRADLRRARMSLPEA